MDQTLANENIHGAIDKTDFKFICGSLYFTLMICPILGLIWAIILAMSNNVAGIIRYHARTLLDYVLTTLVATTCFLLPMFCLVHVIQHPDGSAHNLLNFISDLILIGKILPNTAPIGYNIIILIIVFIVILASIVFLLANTWFFCKSMYCAYRGIDYLLPRTIIFSLRKENAGARFPTQVFLTLNETRGSSIKLGLLFLAYLVLSFIPFVNLFSGILLIKMIKLGSEDITAKVNLHMKIFVDLVLNGILVTLPLGIILVGYILVTSAINYIVISIVVALALLYPVAILINMLLALFNKGPMSFRKLLLMKIATARTS